MKTPLRLLIVEDSEDDTLLIIHKLERAGYELTYKRVETKDAMRDAIEKAEWDIILSDYKMPRFSGPSALKLYQEMGLNIPFIVISGTIGEEIAADIMVSGAHDYVMKNNLSRLVPAIKRELKEASTRRERKKAEYEAQLTYKRFFTVLSSLYAGVLMVTNEGRIEFANQSFCDLFELTDSPDSLRGLTAPEIIQKIKNIYENPTDAIQRIVDIVAKEEPVKGEEVAIRGSRTYMRDFIPIIIDGKRYGRLWHHQDITELKKAEAALQEREKTLKAFFDAVHESMVLIDKKGTVLLSNKTGAQRLGKTVEDFLGACLYECFPPEVAHFRKQHYNQVFDTGKPVYFQDVRLGRFFEQYCYPVFDEYNNVSGVAIFANEITERKLAEEMLYKSEAKYRSIFDNAVEGIFQTTPEGLFLSANPSLARMFGYDSPEELIESITDLSKQGYVNPEDRVKFRNILETQGIIQAFETQHYKKDGSTFWILINARVVRDESGKTLYYEGTIEDITTRKISEEKLRKSLVSTIQVVSTTVETRDPYTAGHQKRVSSLARSIAQEMGLSKETVDTIRMAGVIHDIGKISVPAVGFTPHTLIYNSLTPSCIIISL